jgi:hypothetical protein
VANATSVQRLDDGRTLICSNQVLVEVDREGQEKWRLTGVKVRPWRAQRLENGNTLVTDRQLQQVVEVDPQGRQVWHMEKLDHPLQAVRLEDGNTLILEAARLIEVDPAKRITVILPNLREAYNISSY